MIYVSRRAVVWEKTHTHRWMTAGMPRRDGTDGMEARVEESTVRLVDAIYAAGVADLELMCADRARAAGAAQTVANIVVTAVTQDPEALKALVRLVKERRAELEVQHA